MIIIPILITTPIITTTIIISEAAVNIKRVYIYISAPAYDRAHGVYYMYKMYQVLHTQCKRYA